MTANSENLVFMIHRTHDMLKSCEDKVFGEHGLTTEQYAVLMAIECLDEPVRVTDVAHRLTRSVNTVSMIVERMVKAGLLTRERDGDDRREVRLITTSKGETLLEPATPAGHELARKILSPLSHGDKQSLIRMLETLRYEASKYLDLHEPVDTGS